jgi:hypothetical protein
MVMRMIKSKVLPWSVALVGLALAVYTGRLWMQQAQITTAWSGAQWWGLLIGFVLWMYLFLTRFVNTLVPLSRRTWPVCGIFVIMFSDIYLLDDATRSVFLADALKVISVLMIFLGATKSLVSPLREQKHFDEQVEIIEV